jgi:predicted heme/steroid binding protein
VCDGETYTLDEVAKHTNEAAGVWLVIEGGVYVSSALLSRSLRAISHSISTRTGRHTISCRSPRHVSMTTLFSFSSDRKTGGKKILLNNAGKDATDQFWKYHSKKILQKDAAPLKIGQSMFY